MPEIDRNSAPHLFWYRRFLRCFGKGAYSISAGEFLDDYFCLCYNMSSNLVLEGEQQVTLNPLERRLAPVDAATIDVELSFRNPLPENYVLYACAWYDIFVKYDENGIEIID